MCKHNAQHLKSPKFLHLKHCFNTWKKICASKKPHLSQACLGWRHSTGQEFFRLSIKTTFFSCNSWMDSRLERRRKSITWTNITECLFKTTFCTISSIDLISSHFISFHLSIWNTDFLSMNHFPYPPNGKLVSHENQNRWCQKPHSVTLLAQLTYFDRPYLPCFLTEPSNNKAVLAGVPLTDTLLYTQQ